MYLKGKLNIVIATHKREKLLRRTLDFVSECSFPENFGKVYVIENGSQIAQHLVESYSKLMAVEYIHTATPNKSQALNKVLEQIPEEDFLIFLDDDVRVQPSLLSEYNKVAMEWGPEYYYGGPTEVDYEIPPKEYIKKYLPISAVGFKKSYLKPEVMDSVTLLGFNWGCFKSGLTSIGGFNPNKGPGSPTGSRGQESDAQRKLFGIGLKPVYIPNALVYHYIPATFFTEEWILKRAFQHGMQHGLDRRINDFGLLQRTTMAFLKFGIQLAPLLSSELGLRVKHKFNYYKGLAEGLTTKVNSVN